GTTQNLIFPGAGVCVWWHAGVIQALKERFDLKNGKFKMYGASAGSISCVMAACNVDMDEALEAAFHLPSKSCALTHGRLIELWLHKILPYDCHIICSGKVNISITTITVSFMPLHRKVINTFSSKQDLIDACLTSSHIPFFLDGNFSRTFRGDTCVDGSFLFFLHNTPWS
ncbi:acyl transferase/acyl hydrolase/lysophospholipase, partial [Baffinella frigidus]